jgi:hypothetical protein
MKLEFLNKNDDYNCNLLKEKKAKSRFRLFNPIDCVIEEFNIDKEIPKYIAISHV